MSAVETVAPAPTDAAPSAGEDAPEAPRRPFGVMFWVACGWLALVIASTTIASLVHWTREVDFLQGAEVVSGHWTRTISWAHPLGVDGAGNDTLWELVTGAKNSLLIALVTVVLGFLLGGGLGMVAGYFHGALDGLLSFGTTALLSVPPLLFIILMVSVLSAGTTEGGVEQGFQTSVLKVSLSLAILSIPTLFRVVRASTMQHAEREFVLAARAMGATDARILLREVLPNVVKPMLAYGLVAAGTVMVIEGSLSFLGIGVGAGTETSAWGKMIQEGAGIVDLSKSPNIAMIPAAALFLTVLAFNFIGDKLRDRFDVRQAAI